MNPIKLDIPRPVLVLNIGVAALAAIGLTTLAGAQGQALLGVPLLTAVLTLALLVAIGKAEVGTTRTAAEATTTDPLTGLANVDIARDALGREFAAAQRGRPLAVVLTRLEGLPKYRARHGRAVADQLVRRAGRTLVRHRRGMHLAAPHDVRGGVFLSILSGSTLDGAAVYAARLRKDLMEISGVPPHEGVSVGVAAFELSMASPDELLHNASFALEKADGKVMLVGQRAS